MTIIVTGASGLVGGAVVRGLRARGTPVITVGRHNPELPSGELPSGVHHVDWDLREDAPVDVTALSPRVTAVVHCARLSADWGAPADFHDVNVAGTRKILDAFPRARIVHLSSTAVYGLHRDHTRLYEEAGPLDIDEHRDEFARTAALAEGVLTRVRPDALVLRPARLYSPGEDDGVIDALTRFSRRGVLTLPDGAKNRTMLAHVDTVVAAVIAGLDRPRVSGPVNIADPRPYVLHEAINTYIARTDHPHMTLDSRPPDLAKARAWIAQKRVKAPTARNRPPHTITEIEAYVRERTYDLSRLRSLLDIEPVQHLAPQD
ncbi:MAG: NAD-dependent epimerase/dehydratase family protein [Brevibacterium yomogidense]